MMPQSNDTDNNNKNNNNNYNEDEDTDDDDHYDDDRKIIIQVEGLTRHDVGSRNHLSSYRPFPLKRYGSALSLAADESSTNKQNGKNKLKENNDEMKMLKWQIEEENSMKVGWMILLWIGHRK